MGDCHTKILKVSFDLTDEQLTQVRVEIDFWGDCPYAGMKRVYEKAFPARIPVVDLFTMKDGINDYLICYEETMEGLPTREVVSPVEITPPTAPKHTEEEHEYCAYYVKTEEIAPDISQVIFIDMECPHGFSAGGAWYNEDYVRQLREASHQVIAFLDHADEVARAGRPLRDSAISPYFVIEILRKDWQSLVHGALAELRELTK